MADFYGSVDQADTYFADRANAAWTGSDELKQAALVRGSQYVDGMAGQPAGSVGCVYAYAGVRTGGRSQALAWPRTGAYDRDGVLIDPTEVPQEIINASYEAAVRELTSPGSLMPDFIASQIVKREKVGPLEQEYAVSSDGNSSRPTVTAINSLLWPLMIVRCGNGYAYGAAIFVV